VFPGLRLNLSKSGASVSLGGRGFHYTVGPKGTRTSVGLPGTGLSWTEYTPYGSHSSARRTHQDSPVPYITPTTGASEPDLVPIETKSAEQINAFSTSQLAPELNKVNRRLRFAAPTLITCLCLFLIAGSSEISVLPGLVALYGSIFIPLAIFLDRYRRSVRVSVRLNRTAETITTALSESFSELKKCQKIWRVRAEGQTNDWKRNAGANVLNQRDKISLQIARPKCMRGDAAFPEVNLGNAELYFLPDAVLVISKASVAALHYRDLQFSSCVTHFVESDGVPKDTTVVGHTWRYVNKSGGPDRRFNNNAELPVCRYGEMDFNSLGGLNGKLQFSNASAGERFVKAINILIRYAAADSELSPFASYRAAKNWPSVVFLCFALLIGAALTSVGALTSPTILSLFASIQGSADRVVIAPAAHQDNLSTSSNGRTQAAGRKVQNDRPSITAPLNILPQEKP
jgi:hypothetical protein